MIEITLAVTLAVAIGIASFIHRKRSATFIQLSLLLGGTGIMLLTAITDPGLRWFGMLFTLLGATYTYRMFLKLKME